MPSKADKLLRAAATFHASAPECTPVGPKTFSSVDAALDAMRDALLHEAHEAMLEPLEGEPASAQWHAVDLRSNPGIVEAVTETSKLEVVRSEAPLAPLTYERKARAPQPRESDPEIRVDPDEALRRAEKSAKRALSKMQTAAARDQKHDEAVAEKREARKERMSQPKEERAEKKRKREERSSDGDGQQEDGEEPKPKRPRKPRAKPPAPDVDEGAEPPAERVLPVRQRVVPRRCTFFASPVPPDRHLTALQSAAPHPCLVGALLRGEPTDALQLVQGPPGTGKSHALLRRVAALDFGRAFVCAPTNVGAIQLYERLLRDPAVAPLASLCVAPARIPEGTPVASNDPGARIVVATVSARASPRLDAESFDAVFLDEAGQCTEACAWTLLRADVQKVAMAGDVKQLRATVSQSGAALGLDRSMFERLLVEHAYPAEELTEQRRMHASICAVPNALFYGGALTTHADLRYADAAAYATVKVDGTEERVGTSYQNKEEAEACVAAAHECAAELGEGARIVLLSPYLAQARLLLAAKSGFEVHTIDSFQGREADAVVLSLVRTGDAFGFWEDERRLVVALTRAKKRMRVVGSFRWTAGPLARLG